MYAIFRLSPKNCYIQLAMLYRVRDLVLHLINIYYILCIIYIFFFLWRCDPTRIMASSFTRFLDYTQRRTTVGRTAPDEWSARRRDLYLTTHNTHNRQISMPLVGFEPTISAGERPQTYALDHAATETGMYYILYINIYTLIYIPENYSPPHRTET